VRSILAILAIGGVGVAAVGAAPAAKAAAERSLSDLPPDVAQQIVALESEKAARTPAEQKMDSQLLQAFREAQGQPMAAGVNLLPAMVGTDSAGRLKVDIDLYDSSALDHVSAQLESLGGRVLYPSWQFKTIRAEINLSSAETIASFPDVKFIQGAVGSITSRAPGGEARPLARKETFNRRAARVRAQLDRILKAQGIEKVLAGSVESEGDVAHRADQTRNTFGYMGQGIRIGVLSDSFNATGGAAADVASGDLPGPGNPFGHVTPVTVVQDFGTGSDEGRAMLQIVHDVAPLAQLFFATADVSEAGFASNIQALRNAPNNCNVIIDDVFYFDEPPFQDGIVAQAVNTVTASGALYFSSAGNEGNVADGTAGYFEGDFNDAGSPAFTFPGGAKTGTIHNFGTVASPINGDIITVRGSVYNLNWSDPSGASANDYDLFVVSSAGVVKASSTNIQNGTQNPYEQISPPSLAGGDRLVVFKTNAAAVRAFALNTIRGTLAIVTTGQTHGHSAAVNAFSVAATPAADAFGPGSPAGPYPGPFVATNKSELFTSDGPRRVFFNPNGTAITPGNLLFGTNGGAVRNKPDITAADGVSTTLPSGSGLNPFYGTSASAPHAGAIAALLLSAKPSLTPAQVRTILTTTALDIEAAGYDVDTGFGIVQAFQAMQAVSPTPQGNIVLGTVTPSEAAFSNGNGEVDPGETGQLVVQLTNPGMAAATSVSATLSTAAAGVLMGQATVPYGTISPSGSATNSGLPFTFFVGSSVPCGTVIPFTLTVTFGGGPSPQVFDLTVTVGGGIGTISSTLGTTPPTGPGFTSTSGQQTGRLTRNAIQATCASPKANPGLTAVTGSRQFDAYTFTNTNTSSQCVTVTMKSSNGINLYCAAYNNAGFVPANPSTNFLADQGTSSSTQTYSFTAPAGQAFTVVVHDINVLPTSGSSYTLDVSLAACAAGPACTPVTVSTGSIAGGTLGAFYSQSFAATGGSGIYSFTLTGTLPTGLNFSGNTISGTPTQSGSFPITITPTDVAAGCPSTPKGFVLVIATAPAGLSFNTVVPCRVLDTRLTASLPAGSTSTFALTGGTCGIPATAKAVALNITVVNARAPGFIVVFPADQPSPSASTLNFSSGQTRANNSIVKLATDGSGGVKIRNGSAAAEDVVVDVFGYFQ
jgi:hypothetical protein